METPLFRAMLLLVCLGPSCPSASSCSERGATASAPEGCLLSPSAFAERTAEVKALLARCEEIRELEDGYSFRFPGDDPELAAQLAAVIVAERQCCSFLGFELAFEAAQGPIRLSVQGSPEVKELLTSLLPDRDSRDRD